MIQMFEFLREVYRECKINNILDKRLHFECYSDGMLIFRILDVESELVHRFKIICEKDILEEDTVEKLITWHHEDIQYFSHYIWTLKGDEKLGGKEYSRLLEEN